MNQYTDTELIDWLQKSGAMCSCWDNRNGKGTHWTVGYFLNGNEVEGDSFREAVTKAINSANEKSK